MGAGIPDDARDKIGEMVLATSRSLVMCVGASIVPNLRSCDADARAITFFLSFFRHCR